MINVAFTDNIQRHVECPACAVIGSSVREVLDAVFESNQKARGYVLDDTGAVRKHMTVFVNGAQIKDRTKLSDPVPDGASVYIMQALSGG